MSKAEQEQEQEQEKHWFFCRKCGDDYHADSKEHAKKMMASKWMCRTCIYSWL